METTAALILHFLCTQIIILVIIGCLYWRGKRTWKFISPVPAPVARSFKPRWVWAVMLSCLFLYGALAALLSTAWVKGDDYAFMDAPDLTFFQCLSTAFKHYMNTNSRVGDVIVGCFRLSENRWQLFLLTPLVVTALPFAFWRLLAPENQSIFSAKGLVFIWFSIFLCLQSAYLSHWRPFWCYAASVNYLWSTTATIFFLSLYRKRRIPPHGSTTFQQAGLFLLGLYCGWGTECMAVTLFPLLTLFMLYHVKKRLPIRRECWIGYLGYLWGVCLLFSSPGMFRRNEAVAASRSLDIASLQTDQLMAFLQHLNWEYVNLLKGVSSIITLKGIPLPLHTYFFPFLAERFWQCCAIPSLVCLFLAGCILTRLSYSPQKLLLGAALGVGTAWYCASSYLLQCIPTHMSFLPPSFIVAGAACYLFVNMAGRKMIPQLIATLFVLGHGVSVFVPAGTEAWKWKALEKERLGEICRQREQGIMDLVLESPALAPPKDPLGLITHGAIQENPDFHNNKAAARHYGVHSISQKPYPIPPLQESKDK